MVHPILQYYKLKQSNSSQRNIQPPTCKSPVYANSPSPTPPKQAKPTKSTKSPSSAELPLETATTPTTINLLPNHPLPNYHPIPTEEEHPHQQQHPIPSSWPNSSRVKSYTVSCRMIKTQTILPEVSFPSLKISLSVSPLELSPSAS